MNAFLYHFAFEFRSGVRNKQLLLMNYLFPLGFYLLIGFIMPGINPGFRPEIIPAMTVFAILAATLLGIPDPLVSARENGIFRSYKINGVPSFFILIIPALTTTLHLMITIALITITAPLLFDAPLPVHWLPFFLTLLATILACAGISVLIGVISSSTRMTVLWSQILFVPSMLLGGLMLPYNILPKFAQLVAQLLPATHAMNALNGLAMGASADFSPWASISILAASGLIAFVLAVLLFRWDSHNTERKVHPIAGLCVLLPYLAGILLFAL